MKACATTLESELSPEEQTHLVSTLQNHQLTGRHLEIGTAAGGTLWQMMNSYAPDKRPAFVVVDPMQYFTGQLETVKRNLSDHDLDPERVDFRIMRSADAFRIARSAGETFDFIFIDGVHKLRYVTADLCWTELLNTNGLLVLHDYSTQHPDVMNVANRFLRRNPNYEILSLCSSLLVIRKASTSSRPEVPISEMIRAQIIAPFRQLGRSIAKRWHRLTS